MCYDAPSIDPAVSEATRANTEIGNRMADLAEEQYRDGRAMRDRFAPTYERILESSLGSAEENRQRSSDQWDHYTENFQPIEEQVAKEAANYDSEAEVGRRTGLAAGTVQRQFDAAQEQQARRMASMGISPTSGRSMQASTDNANTLALAKAGAINTERNNTKMTGIQLRQGAAALGRGITSTGLAAGGAATAGNQQALGTMSGQTSQAAGALAPAMSLWGGASGAHNSAANIGLGQYRADQNNAYQDANSTSDTIGTIVGAVGAMMMSSKKSKKNVKPVDDSSAMKALRKAPVSEWDYKEGVGDSGRHVGPMAEDMQAAAGNGVAPGGKQIDIISMLGMHQAAIRDLDRRVGGGEKPPPRRQSHAMESIAP